jgi:hypothetical protein
MEVFNMLALDNRNYILSDTTMALLLANADRIGPDGFLKAAQTATSFRVVRFKTDVWNLNLAIAMEWGTKTLDWLSMPGVETVAECTTFDIATAMFDKTATGASVS